MAIKQILYGISDYGRMRRENLYYIDKTAYLPILETIGGNLFFIRPRRFGKSLFLSMMTAYYDVHYKENFEELFKGTAIYENPTEEQGKYLVLSLNFSLVETDVDRIDDSFVSHVRDNAVDFLGKYRDLLSANPKLDYFSKAIENGTSAADIFSNLMVLTRGVNQRLYVIIDEYDNFANTVLSTSGEAAYIALTHGEGMLRSFFNRVKGGTTGMDAPIHRLFITGVSPVTMDDVTSGFNIGQNVSLNSSLNRMLGFAAEDVVEMIDYYKKNAGIHHDVEYLMDFMTYWYGNYMFAKDESVTLFNSDMVLYFMDNYLSGGKIPEEPIDRNVRIDYGKLRHLIILDRDGSRQPTVNGNFSKLKQIIEDGETSTQLVSGFSLNKLTNPENFKSLLFYFGLLTIKGTDLGDTLLEIPNETVRRLFYDYIKEAYEETGIYALELDVYAGYMKGLAAKGEWEPLFKYLTGKMAESINLRDLMTAEKTIQTFLNVYLGLSNLYIIHSEKELNKGFADLVMEPFLARYENIKYSCVIEIKYLKAGAKPDAPEVKNLIAEAREQLSQYSLDEKYNKTIAKTKLIKLALVFSGHRVMYMGEVKSR